MTRDWNEFEINERKITMKEVRVIILDYEKTEPSFLEENKHFCHCWVFSLKVSILSNVTPITFFNFRSCPHKPRVDLSRCLAPARRPSSARSETFTTTISLIPFRSMNHRPRFFKGTALFTFNRLPAAWQQVQILRLWVPINDQRPLNRKGYSIDAIMITPRSKLLFWRSKSDKTWLKVFFRISQHIKSRITMKFRMLLLPSS